MINLITSIPILGWAWVPWLINVIAQAAVATAIGVGLAYLLRTKPKQAKPAGVSEFELPTAMTGRAVPHVRGKRYVTGYNCLTPIFFYSANKKSSAVYYYYFRLWVGICRVADGIKQIRAGEKTLWPTLLDDSSEAADGQIYITVFAPYVFGGYKAGEGGQRGNIRILYGDSTQTAPTNLKGFFGDNVPAHRGMVSAYFGDYVKGAYAGEAGSNIMYWQYYWGTTKYPKWPGFLVKSTDKDTDNAEIWEVATANVGDGDFNPIHAIYEWIVDKNIGMGKDSSVIGSSFATAAATCYSEGYGLSYVLDSSETTVQDCIEKVCEIINASLWYDPDNATYEIALIRPDYDSGSVESFDETDFWISKFTRPSFGKTPCRTIVHYCNRITNVEETVSSDDITLIEIQGAQSVVMDLDYRAFICNPDVAAMIADRRQAEYSAMPAVLSLRSLRTMSHLHIGSLFQISYPAMGITSMMLRVATIDTGEFGDSEVKIEAIEDVFGSIFSTFGQASTPPTGPTDLSIGSEIYTYWSTGITETGPY